MIVRPVQPCTTMAGTFVIVFPRSVVPRTNRSGEGFQGLQFWTVSTMVMTFSGGVRGARMCRRHDEHYMLAIGKGGRRGDHLVAPSNSSIDCVFAAKISRREAWTELPQAREIGRGWPAGT